MPNSLAGTEIAFAPDAATLDAVLGAIADGEAAGDAVAPEARRAAFALAQAAPRPGERPARGWRYDYDALNYDGLTWSSGAVDAPVPRGATADEPSGVDRPALAVENAGGIYHLGATQIGAGTVGDPRVVVTSLAAARRDHGALLDGALHRVVAPGADRFTALAAAFQNCGAFVYVPAGVALDAPVQLLFGNDESAEAAVFPQIVVVLGDGARATVLERHLGGGEPFVCGTVEILAGDRAELDYVTVQNAGEGARIAFTRGVRGGRDATVRLHLAELGGSLARSVVRGDLGAEGAHAAVSALFFNNRFQHVDLTTNLEHGVPNTTSDTVVRSAAIDRGQGRFYGNIVIRERAHGADASLRDDALLLSKKAKIETVPALEISANDVRAFHGATVGSLDEDALFYAMSRGIPRHDALRLVALGFFEPAVSRFPGELLRDEIRTALDAKIDEATELDA